MTERRILPAAIWPCAALLSACAAAEGPAAKLPPERVALYRAWRAMPVPPITPYSGPFGGEARAFVGQLDRKSKDPKVRALIQAFHDWKRLGTYDPNGDPRPINTAFEAAVLADWRRMGYNCAYKGNAFTFRSGRWLKARGLLGAIDQTLWAARRNPPLTHDGTPGKTYGDGSGSFFHKANHEEGVSLLVNYVKNFGDLDMLKVGKTYVTCSWDEVGMRTRSTIDYRPEAIVEYRRYLREVWFGDAAPGRDTNGDGRTYNAFTGEKLASWDDVRPPVLSPRFYRTPQPADEKWRRTGAFKLWLDFHRYWTFEYFRRVNAEASARLGRPVECYPFPLAFIMWPGANCHWGMSPYWNARLNPIVNVEHCWPDAPAMPLNHAITDRLARKYRNVVIGWSWFFFGKEARDMYDGPYDNARALARMMGRRTDGIHHWLYSPIYRGRDRRQRKQIAYWHNFLAAHYRGFLSRSEPARAAAALLMPDYTGYFYRQFHYPKTGWAYTFQALSEAQIPCEVVTEEELELEPGALDGYKVLYVVGSEWTTPTIRKRIGAFLARGGVVYANVDSLSLDIPTGRRTDFLERTFGVKILRKHKNSFLPSTQDAAEEAWAAELNGWGKPTWLQGHDVHKPGVTSKLFRDDRGQAVRDAEQWKKLDAAMAKMPRRVRGLDQAPIDMRTPPKVRYAPGTGPAAPAVTWGEVDVASVTRGRAIAWWGDRVCGVETDRTVWLGTRPGMSLHAISPRMSMNRTTEPCNPYVTRVPAKYEAHRPYVEAVSYAARKARVRRLVTVRQGGRIPCNLEVLPRTDGEGNLMCFVIDHDGTGGACDVTVDPAHLGKLPRGAQVWDLLNEKLIEERTDGKFALTVPAWKVAVFLLGAPAALAPVKAAQAKLNAMDLSVPKYFLDRPALNEPEYNTPIPPIEK